MVDENEHDPLDPLERAYEITEEAGTAEAGTGAEDVTADEPEVFHGSPVEEEEFSDEIPVYEEPLGPPPPPPPVSPIQKVIRFVLLGGGIFVLVLLIYLGYRMFFGPGTQIGPGELTYWTIWEETTALQGLADEFAEQNPGVTQINIEKNTRTNYRERIQSHITEGEGPDIFRYHNTWVPMLREELAPLPSDIMSREEYSEIFYPIMVEDLSLGDDLVGMPLMYEGLVVFYNEEILQGGGFTRPADNWEAFLSQAISLTVKSEGTVVTSGAALGRADNIEHFSDILGLLMLQNGANPGLPNSEEGVEALIFYRLFSQEPDEVWPGPEAGPEFGNDIRAFAAGRVGMIFAPTWEIFVIEAIQEQLGTEISYSTAPVPQVAGTEEPFAWASYWTEGVNSRSPRQQQAWEFLKFMVQKEQLERFYELTAQLHPPIGEPYPRKDMTDLVSDSPYLAALVEQASYAQSFYMASRTFDNGINDQIIQYYENAVNSLEGGNSPEAALSTAQQGIQQVLSRYGVSVE